MIGRAYSTKSSIRTGHAPEMVKICTDVVDSMTKVLLLNIHNYSGHTVKNILKKHKPSSS